MAGLLDIFGRGDGNLGLLGTSPEDIQKAQQQARAQSLFALADRLYQGGSTGQSIAQGLQQGQQAYNTAMQDKLKQQLQSEEMKQKLAERQRMLQAQQLMGQIQTPAVMPTDPLKDIYGQEQAGPNMPQAAGIDRNVVSRLMQTPEGQASLKQFFDAQKMMRGEAFNLAEGAKRYVTDAFGNTQMVAEGAPKQTTDMQNYEFARSQGFQGSFQDYVNQQKRAGATVVDMGGGQKGFENTSSLKKQFTSEPIYKAYEDMKVSYGQVSSAIKSGTPIGDTAAATKIMKLLDPGSVVRETELGMAMQATGKMDLLKNYFENYMKGTKLTDSQRLEFQSLADELFNAAASAYNTKRLEYKDLGDQFGLNTDVALGKPANIQGGIKRIGWQ